VKGEWKSRLDLVAAAALFSTGGAVIKWCSLSPLQVAGFRSLIAAAFLLLVWPAARRGWSKGTTLFGLLYASTLVTFVAANKLTTAANAIFLQSTAPLYVLLLSPFVLKEKVRRGDLLYMAALAGGLVLCFRDALVAQQGEVQATAPRPLLGNALALASGVLWGGTIVGLRFLGRGTGEGDPGAAASVIAGNLAAFVGCAAISLARNEPFFEWIASPRIADLRALAFLGCLQVGLAYVVLTRGMRSVPALEASLLLLVEPVFNPLWTFLVHGERPGAWAIAGGSVILGATALHAVVQGRRRDRAPAVEVPAS
jgi:drug/metabolite transporter (DMT)-like permease